MKTTHTPTQQAAPRHKYPYLGINEHGTIVLFNDENYGFCLVEGEDEPEATLHFHEDNDERLFLPYPGTVTLTND